MLTFAPRLQTWSRQDLHRIGVTTYSDTSDFRLTVFVAAINRLHMLSLSVEPGAA